MSARKRGLGRGLDALLGAGTQPRELPEGDVSAADGDTPQQVLKDLPVDLIQRGKYQPRRDIDPESLQELADSIRAQGIMQPIVVRPVAERKYEIIAGERRWRAAQLAGLDHVPAVVRDVSDEAAIAMALIENIQREDLNPIEEAIALQRLQQEFQLTQQEVADAVGKSRSTVTNLLRLMSLQSDVRLLLERGDLEMGHARALLGIEGTAQSQAARTVVGKGLSVRQTEALVRGLLARQDQPAEEPPRMDPNIRQLQDDLSQKIGARVQIQHGAKGKGKLVLTYNSLDELDGILSHIR
ncbi:MULTISPECIES: ParB/RepB/Spo0J family partition protein [Haliea]|jgi:ParB family chromosome partitioning protein|uniref:ParB/RepB/Spo0J family partition protein n=1 Tax=Haliea TaxID=475794 RepID=UPI000427A83C|nr:MULTISPECIES: ParB/RepB/Spo0J family partition protein [Haliea]HAN69686.1 ParB/RepB/Spo0J family partition protein [Halieaceae bacterium]MAD65769.1 chromosome partitioning protein ParB [Haliea sp.]MAY91925.1 chromosome partitioning protein ParB [Haliea sp.]MBK41849.1 chromosome partitioning protein ParB [Haliea sp.]MBP70286.1 chromosome partitioning protein ParB [Haliea sp.]|tara:strand:- start:1856 stop:2749 length:894 start_codon:yes stop_codon:yes gene_type:complete